MTTAAKPEPALCASCGKHPRLAALKRCRPCLQRDADQSYPPSKRIEKARKSEGTQRHVARLEAAKIIAGDDRQAAFVTAFSAALACQIGAAP